MYNLILNVAIATDFKLKVNIIIQKNHSSKENQQTILSNSKKFGSINVVYQ